MLRDIRRRRELATHAAAPDPRIADTGMTDEMFFAVDPWDRVLAIARTTSGEVGVSLPG